MKTLLLMFALMATACALAKAADERPIADDPAYLADLDKRGEAVLKDLKLTDADKAARVKQAVVDQYRAIKRADDEALAAAPKDDKAAIAKAKETAAAAKKPLHDAFLAKLSAASLLAIAPILLMGWFSQKQLVRGLTFGAVK